MKEDDREIYLKSTEYIDSDSSSIKGLAGDLKAGMSDEGLIAKKLFYFVRDEIRYNAYMISTHPEDFRASLTLERRQGYCVQKAILLAALARASNIPARLLFAKIRNDRMPEHLVRAIGTNVLPAHGYAQLFIEGKWVSVTPSFDQGTSEKMGLPLVEFDGIHEAVLSPFDPAGRPFIEYLEKYEPEADLPFPWLREKIVPIWGDKRSWLTEGDSKGHVMPSGFQF